ERERGELEGHLQPRRMRQVAARKSRRRHRRRCGSTAVVEPAPELLPARHAVDPRDGEGPAVDALAVDCEEALEVVEGQGLLDHVRALDALQLELGPEDEAGEA